MTSAPHQATPSAPLIQLLLALADDKLVLGHRNSDWTGLGPILEEDIAFSHMAQDEMAHAQAVYELVGSMTGATADTLAFGRSPSEFRCAHLVEVPDEFNWAMALARKFYCDHFDVLRLRRLAQSNVKNVADVCSRLAAEEQLHVEHVDGWMNRLGQGTAESRVRVQEALDALAPLAAMQFEPVEDEEELVRNGTYPRGEGEMFDLWLRDLKSACAAAELRVNVPRPDSSHAGGRRGEHTPHLKELLDEMGEVWRVEPGAAW